jgi:hypothetical protein
VSYGRFSRHPKLNDGPFVEQRRKGRPDEKLSPNHDDFAVGLPPRSDEPKRKLMVWEQWLLLVV